MTAEEAGAAAHAPKESASVVETPKRKHTPEENVRRLQARIVKAQKAGKYNKMKVLQRLLVHSQSAKNLAVERVSTNDGKATPGVDGETWLTSEKRVQAIETLQIRGYAPLPLKRVYIPKKSGSTKQRGLGIPTMKDRAMQALYLLALDPVAETTADPNSYGFRRERSCADAMSQCFGVLAKRDAPQWVLEADIKACFDRIDHDWLLAHIPMDRVVLKKWLKSGYVEKLVRYPTEEGSPQGGPISPVLANLTLDGMERVLREKYPAHSRKAARAKVNLIRYADDFVITGSSKQLLEDEVKPLIADFLGERGLELSSEKTSLTHIANGFDFLGQNVRKYDGKLIIKPSKANVATFLANIREVVKENQTATAGHLVLQLTPKIKGWAMYHRHICAKRIFQHVDSAIFKVLWQWSKRRHPNKSHQWIARKYYTKLAGPAGGNQWTFFGEIASSDGGVRPVALFSASRVPIRRHIKIRSDVNPYDPSWKTYLDRRHKREETRSGPVKDSD